MLLLMLRFVWLICWIQVLEFSNGNGKCQILYNGCTFLLDVYFCSFIFVKPVSILFTRFTISLVALVFVPWNVLAWLDSDYEVGLSFFNVALIYWHTLHYLQDCRKQMAMGLLCSMRFEFLQFFSFTWTCASNYVYVWSLYKCVV